MPHRPLLADLTQQIAVVAAGMVSASGLLMASVWEAVLSAERLTGAQVFLVATAAAVLGSVVSLCFLDTQSSTIRAWCARLFGSTAASVFIAPALIYWAGITPNAYTVFFIAGVVALFAKIGIRAAVPMVSRLVRAGFVKLAKRFGVELEDPPCASEPPRPPQ